MAKPSLSRRLARRFEAGLERHGLIRRGDRVLVAFSGGQDSTALLALLLGIKEAWSLDIALAHFNHHLRRSAAADARFAARTAREHGLKLYSGEGDVRGYALRRKMNLEEAARELRYDFLRKTAARIKAHRIATGHTLTDQAETFLMRLFRGSGPTGLTGIAPRIDGLIVRPLLDFERGEITTFLREIGWPHRQDESNLDPKFLRNRIRRELIPRLTRDYDPAIVKHLGRAALILQDEEGLIEGSAERAGRRAIRRDGSLPALDLARVRRMPAGLRRRVIRLFLRELKGDLRGVSFDDIEAAAAMDEGKDLVLGPRLTLRREGGFISTARGKRPPPRYDFLWDGRGVLDIPLAGTKLRAKILRDVRLDKLSFDDESRACLDASLITLPLRVRTRKAGDRYRPLGAPGAKKLKEILRAKGIPLDERDRRPVILSGNRIVWMPGIPVGDAFRVTPETSRVLLIERVG
jgi:tRNA(Ile)-lysidine synthase